MSLNQSFERTGLIVEINGFFFRRYSTLSKCVTNCCSAYVLFDAIYSMRYSSTELFIIFVCMFFCFILNVVAQASRQCWTTELPVNK